MGFYYGLLLFLPLYGSIFSLIFKKYLGFHGICIIHVFQYIILNIFFFSFFFFCNDIKYYSGVLDLGIWFVLGKKLTCSIVFHLDHLSFIMSWLVICLGFLALLYGYDYCKDEPNGDRVIILLSIFIFSMILLFNAYNLIVFITAWECTGLISCFLINYWNTKINALKSSLKSFVVNRFGDFGLLFACYIMSYRIDNFNFSTLNTFLPVMSFEYINFLGFNLSIIDFLAFFLLLAVFTKSAQFMFHSWLPDAMEAPTPASALIHSSAMVIAGIYLMMRLSDIFLFTIYAKKIALIFGSLTALYCGFIACFQVDLKKILAFSTVSHLGIMVGGCGLGLFDSMLIYLLNHSLSKCLLFFSAGVIIVYVLNIQDIRRMGGLINYIPITFYAFLLSSFSLIGWPFFNGFYAKHFVLEMFYINSFFSNIYFISFIFAGIFTLIYLFKGIIYVFFGPVRGYIHLYKKNWTYYSIDNLNHFKFFVSQGSLCIMIMLFLIFLNIIGFDRCIIFYNFFFINWSINLSNLEMLNSFSFLQPYFTQWNSLEVFFSSWALVFFWLSTILLSTSKIFLYRFKFIFILFVFFICIEYNILYDLFWFMCLFR